jgi:hypothetical protein
MGEDYLLLRRAALLARTNDAVSNIESTIKQLADVNLALGSGGGSGGSIDISTLAKDATSTAINAKLPSLSSGRVPVSLPTITAELDCRLLTTNTTIATGSYFIYLKVIAGGVTINGLTFSSGENLNFEAINNVLYPAIELVISSGKSVRLVRGY